MNLPHNTGVNFVEHLNIVQEYEQMPDSSWVLTDDDMTVELGLMKKLQGVEIQRTTKYTDYDFEEIEARLFRLKGDVVKGSQHDEQERRVLGTSASKSPSRRRRARWTCS